MTLPPLTCQQIQPAYEAAGHDANLAYEAALAVKHLRRIDLARDGTRSPPGEDSPEQPLEPLVAWAPFTDRVDGRTVTAIASDVYLSDRGHALVEFVTDGNGGLWRVKRSPHSRIITSVSVEACSWGCWGGPSSPVPMRSVPTQDVWVVPAGATFRGEIEIEYDEPTVDVLIVDLQCPSPA
ncbi:MAG: hypothetical protein IPQ07_23605 [Myxococcales bacterium]|nr:hypothetical protein [Myxococcales bacterium]